VRGDDSRITEDTDLRCFHLIWNRWNHIVSRLWEIEYDVRRERTMLLQGLYTLYVLDCLRMGTELLLAELLGVESVSRTGSHMTERVER
jgi:hypothetical protein